MPEAALRDRLLVYLRANGTDALCLGDGNTRETVLAFALGGEQP